MMTAMSASLLEAYKIYVTAGANGKQGATAELTVNLKNKNAIASWNCKIVLPAGVTFQSAELLNARVPEGYEAQFNAVANEDGTVDLSCEGAEGVALTGTDGAVAKIVVAVAADAAIGDCTVNVKSAHMEEVDGTEYNRSNNEFTWTIEEGAPAFEVGDVNCDGKVDIADAVTVLNAMAGEQVPGNADVNADYKIDIADFVTVLNIMAGITY
jgi:hypothetical protein